MNVVFDCDGTLISSHQSVLKNLKQLVSEEKGREYTDAEIIATYDADMLTCAKNFGLDMSNPERIFKRWIEISRTYPKARAYDGIQDALESLEQRGHRLLVWTGRDRASTLELLRLAGILRYFEELVCADDITPKPHPAGLAKLLDGEVKKLCVHIGDSYTDIQGAKSYGIESVGALWGEHANKAEFKNYEPNYWATHPSEILKIVEAKHV